MSQQYRREHEEQSWRAARNGSEPMAPGIEPGRAAYEDRYEHGGQRAQRAGAGPAPQSFAGRGPKGHRRSDVRILEDVSERLLFDHDVDASDITVQVRDGKVTLSGTVADPGQRHRADAIAAAVGGVNGVANQLRVPR